LLRDKKITPTQLASALTRQSSELIYNVLRWRSGRFEFRRDRTSTLADTAKLGLSVATLMLEGFRRVDEWQHLELVLGSFESVLVQDKGALSSIDLKSLPKGEQTILALVDGNRTIREIMHVSPMSTFDTSRALVQFLGANLVARKNTN
jgi:hypothetical protein